MRRDHTAAKPCQTDDRSRAHPAAQPGAITRTLGHAPHTAANLGSTLGVIAGLLLVWVLIVTN